MHGLGYEKNWIARAIFFIAYYWKWILAAVVIAAGLLIGGNAFGQRRMQNPHPSDTIYQWPDSTTGRIRFYGPHGEIRGTSNIDTGACRNAAPLQLVQSDTAFQQIKAEHGYGEGITKAFTTLALVVVGIVVVLVVLGILIF